MNHLKIKSQDYMLRFKEQVLKRSVDKTSLGGGQHQKESEGIPLGRKLCYALGGVPNQMTTVAIGVSLQIFLLDIVWKLSMWL